MSTWLARRGSSGNTFAEFSGTWEQAAASVSGYGTDAILSRVADATRAVERGEAAFERDSVLFTESEFTWPLLVALLRAANRDGRLHVLDYGGALGSTYRQNRHLLDDVTDVRWAVVEQPDFVHIGCEEFATDRLSFHHAIDAVSAPNQPNVVLLGSSLQYMPSPMALLDRLASTSATTLVLDRTPLAQIPDDLLTIQAVPPSIYEAAYPMWVLSRPRLLAWAAARWPVCAAYDGGYPRLQTAKGVEFGWDGLILER